MTTGVTASEIADIVERIGTWGLRFKPGYAFGTGTFTELPPASEDYQNLIAVVVGGAGEADQLWYCRKNADDSYEWIPLGVSETTIAVWRIQPVDESAPPGPTDVNAIDPYAAIGLSVLNAYREGRMRCTLDPVGTVGVEAAMMYSLDGVSYLPLLGNTVDFGAVASTTEWEALPAEVLDADAYVYLRVSVTGTGSENPVVNAYLDLRG